MTPLRHEPNLVSQNERDYFAFYRAECPDCPWKGGWHFKSWAQEEAFTHHQEHGVRQQPAQPNPHGWKKGLTGDAFYGVYVSNKGDIQIMSTIVDGVPKIAQGRPVLLHLSPADAGALRDILDEALNVPDDPEREPWRDRYYEREEPIAASGRFRGPVIEIEARQEEETT